MAQAMNNLYVNKKKKNPNVEDARFIDCQDNIHVIVVGSTMHLVRLGIALRKITDQDFVTHPTFIHQEYTIEEKHLDGLSPEGTWIVVQVRGKRLVPNEAVSVLGLAIPKNLLKYKEPHNQIFACLRRFL